MTHENNYIASERILEPLIQYGTKELNHILTILLNEAMKLERTRHLNASPYERSEERVDYANGFKDKTLKTQYGELHLKIPQTRHSDFYPQSLERGQRSERALKLALAEMYVQGVSTRKVTEITEQMLGIGVSSSEVARCNKLLDEELDAWRNRPLGEIPYIILDARYEKVRHGGQVIDCAVLIAMGINTVGKREILGVSVDLGEQEVHWRKFLQSLVNRGLSGVRYIVSDAHSGLKAGKTAVFPSVPWQRCQFHLQQNAQSYVPKQRMKREVALAIRAIFQAGSKEQAQELLARFLKDYETKAPKLVEWAETALPEGLTVFCLPEKHRQRMRTSNVVERTNKEIKRRTRVATLFPNEKSCLRLVSAILMEISEEWLTGKTYLNMQEE